MLDNIPYCAVRHRTYYDFKPYRLKNVLENIINKHHLTNSRCTFGASMLHQRCSIETPMLND